MKRRVLQSGSAIGLVLTFAASGLTISAAWRPRYISRTWTNVDGRITYVIAADWTTTQFGLSWDSYDTPPPVPQSFVLRLTAEPLSADVFLVPPPPPPPAWERIGFQVGWLGPFIGTGLMIPTWFGIGAPAATTLALLPPLLRDRRRRARLQRGLCMRCGYDLRGAAHERCPECGDAVESPAART